MGHSFPEHVWLREWDLITMMRVLVTGAGGFVGSVLTRRLLQDGYDVHVVTQPGTSPWRLTELRDITAHAMDIADTKVVREVIHKILPERIFHLAAHGAYPSQTDLQEMIRTNVVGTANLLQAALETDVEVFLNTGSSSEYGVKDHAPRENEPLSPNSDYAVTKATTTLLCCHHGKRTNKRIITLRLYSAYGPFEEPSRFMPRLLVCGMRGRYPPLVQPNIARDFVYIDDIVDAFVRAADQPGVQPGGVYNIASGKQTTLHEAVSTARGIFKIPEE